MSDKPLCAEAIEQLLHSNLRVPGITRRQIGYVMGAYRKTMQQVHLTELRLCETKHLVMRPNRLYLFTVDPNCDPCVSLKDLGDPNNA